MLADTDAPLSPRKTLSPRFRLAGSAEPLNAPITLTLQYDATAVTKGHRPAVYYYNEPLARWIYIGGTVNADGSVTAQAFRFATFAVLDSSTAVFPDLAGHWAADDVSRLAGMEAVNGYEDGLFHPDAELTRAQFAKIAAAALGLQAAGSGTPFADAADIPAWSTSAAEALAQAGFMQGDNGRFKPGAVMTRAELAVVIARILRANGVNPPASAALPYRDAAGIPVWAREAAAETLAAGVLSGSPDNAFRPSGAVTRAEAAAALFKLLQALHI